MGDVVLFSGGIDSLLCLHYSMASSCPLALFIDYGQPSKKQEYRAAKKLADILQVELETAVLERIGEKMESSKGSNYIPERNFQFIRAAKKYGSRIFIGANQDDFMDYLDCRRDILDGYEKILGVEICTPLIQMGKAEIFRHCLDIDLPIDECWFCYDPIGDLPCLSCNSCLDFLAAQGE